MIDDDIFHPKLSSRKSDVISIRTLHQFIGAHLVLNMRPIWDKLKFNREVVWLKLVYTLHGFGILVVLPFIPLQMASLGLNAEDISLILGLIPFILTFTTPILGETKAIQVLDLRNNNEIFS